MPGQRAQSHSMTATKLASPHPALAVQSSQTRNLFAATSTNSHSRLFCHKKSPSHIARCLQVRWSDAYVVEAHRTGHRSQCLHHARLLELTSDHPLDQDGVGVGTAIHEVLNPRLKSGV